MKIYKRLDETKVSRIWQHTKDGGTFAIIGSRDKDTGEDYSDKLYQYARSGLGKKQGFTKLEGTYTYKDGHTDVENSVMINNISKEDALKIAKDLNQETIIWKDPEYFGFLTADGKPDGEFENKYNNMIFNHKDLELFGSRLARRKNQKFMFEWFAVQPVEKTAVEKLGSITLKREKLLEFSLLDK